jgi:hypothetical protein
MNFIYTYVPKEDDKKLNSEFYLIDVILLVLSASKVKKMMDDDDKLIFYSTQEFSKYFSELGLFDEIREVPNVSDYLMNQVYEYCHKNCIYKIFIAVEQTEPFITIDHDFIIYNKEFFDKIKLEDLVFSFKEFTDEDAYINTYLPTYNQVVERMGDSVDVLNDINKEYSINASISGGKRFDIIKESYIKITDFYINNYEYLNTLPLMTMFLEQFLLSGQLMNYDVNPYYCWDDFENGSCVHLTGYRYEIENRKRISEELKNEFPNIYDFIKIEFGFYPNYMT